MFRLVNNRKGIMINPKVTVTLSLSEKTIKENLQTHFIA